MAYRGKTFYCDFCQKPAKQTKLLITAGRPPSPNVAICDECVDLSAEILLEKKIDFATFKLIPKDIAEMMGFKPIFSGTRFEADENSCFYLGPFTEPFTTIYKDHVLPTLVKNSYSVGRADEIFSTDAIIEDIWKGINSASFIVADVTGRNPNVMYEIGMAHTVGKPVLLISQSVADIPFDLRHRRCLIYNYTPPGCRKLEEGISQTVTFLRRRVGRS